jgi:hypothetical protein
VPKRFCTLLLLVLVISVAFFSIGHSYSAAQQPIANSARCLVNVPSDWGDYIGASQYGMVFKDDQGTLRFITRVPCGHEGPPNIAVEIRRK